MTTKLTRFANGKVSNKALNLLANTAGMAAAALTLTTAVAFVASTPANAAEFNWKAFGQAAARELQEYGDREVERNSRQTFCTTNYIGSTAYTNCY